MFNYDTASKHINSKDVAITDIVQDTLSRCSRMFRYNINDEVTEHLDYFLFTGGHCFATKHEGKLYIFQGNLGGELDAYNEYTRYIVSNPALNLTKEFDIKKDGILILNNSQKTPLVNLIYRYATLIVETNLTIKVNDILVRMTEFLSASDDKSKQSADLYIKKIVDGDISVIGETSFLDGLKAHTANTGNNTVTQLVELSQYLKASLLNEIGVNANYNMKRESLNVTESAMNDDFLLPLIDDMYHQRKKALEKINEMFGTSYTIEYDSVWETVQAENKKQKSLSEDIASGDVEEHPVINEETERHENNDGSSEKEIDKGNENKT